MTAPVVFLPGILMPCAPRYAPLIDALGPGVRSFTKDLEVYRGPTTPPGGYTLDAELDGLDRFADEHSLEDFHLYAHSGGGAVSLAYVARDPSRVISLALDEPARDYSRESYRSIREDFVAMSNHPDDSFMADFAASMMKPGAEPPPRPPGPPPDWMANRPAGVRAFVRALASSDVDPGRSAPSPAPCTTRTAASRTSRGPRCRAGSRSSSRASVRRSTRARATRSHRTSRNRGASRPS